MSEQEKIVGSEHDLCCRDETASETLLAAAPDMLKALEACLPFMEYFQGPKFNNVVAACDQLKAAIKLAKGAA